MRSRSAGWLATVATVVSSGLVGGLIAAAPATAQSSAQIAAKKSGFLDTKITSTVTEFASPAEVSISFTATGGSAKGYVCTIDLLAIQDCNSPWEPATLTSGSHIFTVAAVDSLGLVDPVPAVLFFTVAGEVTPSESPSPTPTVEPSPTATVEPTPTVEPSPTSSPTATPTPSPTITSNPFPQAPFVYTNGRAKAIRNGTKLRVDVNPDWTGGPYKVRVQRLQNKRWVNVTQRRATGPRNLATFDLRRGRYRVVVPGGRTWSRWVSRPVRLTR